MNSYIAPARGAWAGETSEDAGKGGLGYGEGHPFLPTSTFLPFMAINQ